MSAIEAVSVAIYTHEMDEPPKSTEQAMSVFGPTARIAVTTLAARGDITDEQIAEAVEQALYPAPTYRLDAIEAVRALLARQAAVHASREAEREAKGEGA